MTTNQQVQTMPFFELGYYSQVENEKGEKIFVKTGIPINKNPPFPCSGSEYVSEEELNNYFN